MVSSGLLSLMGEMGVWLLEEDAILVVERSFVCEAVVRRANVRSTQA